MFHEVINLKGHLEIVLFGNDGIEKDRRSVDNLVTTAGKVFIASRMDGTSSGAMSHMAVGTSTTAAAVGQTTLVSESARVAEFDLPLTAFSHHYCAKTICGSY